MLFFEVLDAFLFSAPPLKLPKARSWSFDPQGSFPFYHLLSPSYGAELASGFTGGRALWKSKSLSLYPIPAYCHRISVIYTSKE